MRIIWSLHQTDAVFNSDRRFICLGFKDKEYTSAEGISVKIVYHPCQRGKTLAGIKFLLFRENILFSKGFCVHEYKHLLDDKVFRVKVKNIYKVFLPVKTHQWVRWQQWGPKWNFSMNYFGCGDLFVLRGMGTLERTETLSDMFASLFCRSLL